MFTLKYKIFVNHKDKIKGQSRRIVVPGYFVVFPIPDRKCRRKCCEDKTPDDFGRVEKRNERVRI